MNYNVRSTIQKIYEKSANFKKRKFDLAIYKPFFEQMDKTQFLVIGFREFPGDFIRRLILRSIAWWGSLDLTPWLNAIQQLQNDELSIVYIFTFMKRYFDIDFTVLYPNKDLYMKPVIFFIHSKEWLLELDRMNVDKNYFLELQKELYKQFQAHWQSQLQIQTNLLKI